MKFFSLVSGLALASAIVVDDNVVEAENVAVEDNANATTDGEENHGGRWVRVSRTSLGGPWSPSSPWGASSFPGGGGYQNVHPPPYHPHPDHGSSSHSSRRRRSLGDEEPTSTPQPNNGPLTFDYLEISSVSGATYGYQIRGTPSGADAAILSILAPADYIRVMSANIIAVVNWKWSSFELFEHLSLLRRVGTMTIDGDKNPDTKGIQDGCGNATIGGACFDIWPATANNFTMGELIVKNMPKKIHISLKNVELGRAFFANYDYSEVELVNCRVEDTIHIEKAKGKNAAWIDVFGTENSHATVNFFGKQKEFIPGCQNSDVEGLHIERCVDKFVLYGIHLH